MRSPAAIRRAVMALAFYSAATVAAAATINVTTTGDVINPNDGLCSLREAVIAANTDTVSGPVAGECAAGSGSDTINLPAGTYTLTIAPTGAHDATSGDLNITASVNIVGAGNPTVTGGGGWADGIFDVSAGTVAMTGFTITGGNRTISSGVSGGGGLRTQGPTTLTSMTITANTISSTGGAIADGGGIFAGAGAPLVITDSTISNNTTTLDSGGALYSLGALTMTGSTVSGNKTLGASFSYTGGILLFYNGPAGGQVVITNSTIANNTATTSGGAAGLFVSGNSAFTMTLRNVTIAGNSNPDVGGLLVSGANAPTTLYDTLIANNSGTNAPDCRVLNSAVITSGGNNLIGDNTGCTITGAGGSDQIGTGGSPVNPLLGALANNGGPTPTLALTAGSPAIDAGSNATCAATDQRGVARPQGVNCDIGAFEVAAAGTAPVITNGPPGNGTLGVPYNFAFTATGSPAPTFSVTSGALPNGLNISSAGVISGTPTVAGPFSGVITATNGVAPDAAQSFNIVIAAAPVLTAAPIPTLGETALALLALLVAATAGAVLRRRAA